MTEGSPFLRLVFEQFRIVEEKAEPIQIAYIGIDLAYADARKQASSPTQHPIGFSEASSYSCWGCIDMHHILLRKLHIDIRQAL